MPGDDGVRDVTYVALVHGVATHDPDVWASGLLSRVVRRWSEREDYAVENVPCRDDCRLHPGRHRHLRVTRDGRAESIDLEAVYWGSLVHAGSRPVALRQTFHIGGAVLLADFTAVWSSIAGGNTYRAAEDRPGPVLAIGRLLSLLVRVVAAPLIVAALIAMVTSQRFRLAVADVYEWMTDDGVRAEIVSTVTDSVRRARAERVALVGHSQGGSVVLSARDVLRADGRMSARDPVTTFGNADPLLRTVQRFGIQGGLGRYWLLLIALWILAVIVAVVPAFALASLLIAAGKVIGAALAVGGALWLLPAGGIPDGGTALSGLGNFTALRDSAGILALGIVPAAVAAWAISLLLNRTGLSRRVLAGPDETGAAGRVVPGHDVVARDDPLAPLIRAIGARERLRQIPQTASILLDHQSYFRNSATALPVMLSDIWRPETPDAAPDAGNRSSSPAHDESGADVRVLTTWYSTGLRTRRLAVFLLWAAGVAGVVTLAAATGSTSLGVLALVAISGGAAWIRLVLLWRWMQRMDTAARTGPHVVARAVRRRRTRRSAIFTVTLCVAAILAGGAATVSGQAGALAAGAPGMATALATLSAGLVAAAAGSRSGTVPADAAGMTCLVTFSALWLVHGPVGWIAVGIAALISAVRAVALVRETFP